MSRYKWNDRLYGGFLAYLSANKHYQQIYSFIIIWISDGDWCYGMVEYDTPNKDIVGVIEGKSNMEMIAELNDNISKL